MAKLIKTLEEYQRSLAELQQLVGASPRPGSPDAERLELLGVLVEEYEGAQAPVRSPGPIEAIRFRMEQGGLTTRDLVAVLGSRSRVSEIMSGQRELTLPMIRALHQTLGIPAESLLLPSQRDQSTLSDLWERLPIKEMLKRGWLKAKAAGQELVPEELLSEFLAPLGGEPAIEGLYRQTRRVRSGRQMDRAALFAWTVRVLARAAETKGIAAYSREQVTQDFLTALVRMSRRTDGPLAAINELASVGIVVIVESHLPRTWLDGAALLDRNGSPVIGLTIRHDRTDNFWFTLIHECAHIVLHLGKDMTGDLTWAGFFDDLDVATEDTVEMEADVFSGEILVPRAEWEASAAHFVPSPEAVTMLADKLGISPAIVAGRVRHERKSYRLLARLVGHGEVRPFFPDIS